ncbi:MAG: divalent cation transporter [Gammaproteobacteria bacterium]|nr:divalent cation transporter [Gammaproteobacteria bacterium]
MSLLITVVVSSLLAGLAMALGAAVASVEKIEQQWLEQEFRHSVMAFGGGALLSAVALVLVPEGMAHLEPLSAAMWFIGGGFSFMLLDILLYKINTPASQLAAMLSDFIPESIALGAAFATGSNNAFLLAGLIALQNLPEGFSASRELNESGTFSHRKIITMFALMALLGPVAAVSGYLWLSDYPVIVAAIMLFAAGGILYSIFQDLAPQVKLEKHWAPPMGAIFGFVLGMMGFMMTSH